MTAVTSSPDEMWAACLYGQGDLRIERQPAPRITHDDDVLIRIRACGVCPSDVRSYVRPTKHKGQLPQTIIPGHEWVGEVVTSGSAVTEFTPGDRVAVNWRVVCFDLALRLIEYEIIDVAPLISHSFPLAETRQAFDVVVGRSGIKVMVEITVHQETTPEAVLGLWESEG